MADYIEREALQKQLNRKKPGPADRRYTDGWNDAVLMFKSMVHSAKAADVAPVRHGEWLWLDGYGEKFACSECLEIFDTDADDANAGNEWNFCPKCGAKMDGGETT